MPRVLAITTEHTLGDLLLGPLGARELLTGETKITARIGEPQPQIGWATDLRNSVFFRWKSGKVDACRTTISSVLLFAISPKMCSVVGVLHPAPMHVLPISVLPDVPFIRLTKWPPEKHMVETEWVIYHPRPAGFHYVPAALTDSEP
jgi:hypothetical protein